MDAHLLAVLAEPNRLRIVELLAAAPRSVGEIALALGLRQPQATKHLQVLERAGVVAGHRLGQRRIYALRHEPFRALRSELAAFEIEHPSETVLERYRAAIAEQEARMRGLEAGAEQGVHLERRIAAPVERVWQAWTTSDALVRWWAPAHFRVVDARIEPWPGGQVRLVLAEGDGAVHLSEGVVRLVEPPSTLVFDLAPIDEVGRRLMETSYDVALQADDGVTVVSLTMRVRHARPEAVSAVAGIELGWNQLLDNLLILVEGTNGGRA